MSEIEIYKSADKKIEIQVQFDKDTVWLSQQQLATLFGQTKQNISLHINNCFKEKELAKKATVKESLTVQTEGKRTVQRPTQFYNLDLILAIGYDQDCSWPDCWRHAFPGTIRVVFPTGQREWLPRQAHEAEVL